MRALRNMTVALSLAAASAGVFGADLIGLAAGAVKGSLTGVPQNLEQETGVPVHFEFGTAGALKDKALQGARFDIIILTSAAMQALLEQSVVERDSCFTLGTVSLGLSVAKGRAVPDIGNLEAFRQTLLAAQAIGITDPASGGASGIYLMQLFEKLGLSGQLKDKIRLYPDGQHSMQAAADGEVNIALGPTSEAVSVPGLEPLQLLPDAAQLRTSYVAAISVKSGNQEAAAKLLAALKTPSFQAALQANGFAPAR